MYSARQLQYLKAMGIPAWERRDTIAAAPAPAMDIPGTVPTVQNEDFSSWLSKHPLRELGGKSEPLYALGPAGSALLILSDCQPAQPPQGQPFLGSAGKMLDAMLKAIKQSRTTCQLAALAPNPVPDTHNPPSNPVSDTHNPPSNPVSENPVSDTHTITLQQWASTHKPKVIVYFTRPENPVVSPDDENPEIENPDENPDTQKLPGRQSGQPPLSIAGAHCIVSYHPEYLLQHTALKRQVWEDLKLARQLLA